MTWSCFKAVRLNGRLGFEVFHPYNTLGIARDMNPIKSILYSTIGMFGVISKFYNFQNFTIDTIIQCEFSMLILAKLVSK